MLIKKRIPPDECIEYCNNWATINEAAQQIRNAVFAVDPYIPIDDMPVEEWLVLSPEAENEEYDYNNGLYQGDDTYIFIKDGNVIVERKSLSPYMALYGADVKIWIYNRKAQLTGTYDLLNKCSVLIEYKTNTTYLNSKFLSFCLVED